MNIIEFIPILYLLLIINISILLIIIFIFKSYYHKVLKINCEEYRKQCQEQLLKYEIKIKHYEEVLNKKGIKLYHANF